MKKTLALLCVLVLVCATLPSFAAQEEVNVYNWEDYISDDAIALFEEETGIKVNYMRFDLCETMYVQVAADPSGFDVIFPSDYMVERLINEDLLEEIDYTNCPNALTYTPEWMQNADYDPGMKYSVPYMWGTVGILYNKNMVSTEIDSWTDLWDETYMDNIFMLDSIRDTMGVTLKMLGYSVNEDSDEALEQVKEMLISQKQSGVVKAYQIDETKDKMIAGEAALAVMWSGDASYAMSFSDDLCYVVPKEGSNVWIDAMCIPKGAENKTNAEIFIDFMCRPDVAMMNYEEIHYCSPNTGVTEQLTEEQMAQDNYPSDETVANCEFFHDISRNIKKYERIWNAFKSAR